MHQHHRSGTGEPLENLAIAYSDRGYAYDDKGDYDRAIADYDKAIQLKPDYAEAYDDRGYAYGNKGDYDRAIADYDKAIQLKPDYADAYDNRGDAYGKGDRQALTIPRAAQLIPESDRWHSQALARITELEKQLRHDWTRTRARSSRLLCGVACDCD